MKILVDQAVSSVITKANEDDGRILPALKERAFAHHPAGSTKRFMNGVEFADKLFPDGRTFIGVTGAFGILLFEMGTDIQGILQVVRSKKLLPLPDKVAVKFLMLRIRKLEESLAAIRMEIQNDFDGVGVNGKKVPNYSSKDGTPAAKLPFPQVFSANFIQELRDNLKALKEFLNGVRIPNYLHWWPDRLKELDKALDRDGVTDSVVADCNRLLQVKKVLEA